MDMTPFEISTLVTLITATGGILLGVMKIVGGQTAAKSALVASDKRKTSEPPPRTDHGPCNDAVDRMCVVVEKSVEKQDRLLLAFERWMAAEEAYRKGRRDGAVTGEFPVTG